MALFSLRIMWPLQCASPRRQAKNALHYSGTGIVAGVPGDENRRVPGHLENRIKYTARWGVKGRFWLP